MFPYLHGYFISVHSCLRGSSQFLASYGNQEGSLGTGVLDGRSHEPVDKLLHDDLAGECLGDLDYRREIELLDRCFDRAHGTRCALVLPESRMKLIQLPHFAVGSPSQIAGPSLPQISVSDHLEVACGVEAGGQLIGEGLVMDKFARSRRLDRRLVKTLGVQRATFEASDLSADQRCTILEVLRANRRPAMKLLLVPLNRFSMLGVCVGPPGFTPRGASQSGIKVKVRRLRHELCRRSGSCVPCLGLFRSLDRRCVVSREEAGLELSDPVETFQHDKRRKTGKTLLEEPLRKSAAVE